MKEFEIKIVEHTEKTVYVNAETYEEAEKELSLMISRGSIDLERFDNYSLDYEYIDEYEI